MATQYPNQTFPVMQDISPADAELLASYQNAMMSGDFAKASTILHQIVDYDKKIITAELLNTIMDTILAAQEDFQKRYSPAYIVSATQPEAQEEGDYWFEIIA